MDNPTNVRHCSTLIRGGWRIRHENVFFLLTTLWLVCEHSLHWQTHADFCSRMSVIGFNNLLTWNIQSNNRMVLYFLMTVLWMILRDFMGQLLADSSLTFLCEHCDDILSLNMQWLIFTGFKLCLRCMHFFILHWMFMLWECQTLLAHTFFLCILLFSIDICFLPTSCNNTSSNFFFTLSSSDGKPNPLTFSINLPAFYTLAVHCIASQFCFYIDDYFLFQFL